MNNTARASASADDAARPLIGGRKTDSASMASSRAAVMRKRYNRLFYRVVGIKHGSLARTGLHWNITHVPMAYACAADGCKAVWLDGSETRETCHDGFKAVPTALKRARRF